jgi:microcystin-dependent protein
MSNPYMSEIRIMSFNFPPKGWALCNGQLLSITQNQGLFSLLGTAYGGDGRTTFALPNLQGRVPIHFPSGSHPGQIAGEPAHMLQVTEMPAHTHLMAATAATATTDGPAQSEFLAQGQSTASGTPAVNLYSTANQSSTFAPSAISSAGGGQPHENRQPFLVLNFCIALQGIFPSPG